MGADFRHISIVAGAHPHILSLPKLFANATEFSSIDFVDERYNAIRLQPQSRLVIAELEAGQDLMLNLPDTYRIYLIRLSSRVGASDADLDYIADWHQTEALQISDTFASNVAYGLSLRLDRLKAMTRLKDIRLNVQRHSYKELSVRAFLMELPQLRTASFYKKLLSREERKDFAGHLNIPDGWQSVDRNGFVFIERRRLSPAQLFLGNLVSSLTPL